MIVDSSLLSPHAPRYRIRPTDPRLRGDRAIIVRPDPAVWLRVPPRATPVRYRPCRGGYLPERPGPARRASRRARAALRAGLRLAAAALLTLLALGALALDALARKAARR